MSHAAGIHREKAGNDFQSVWSDSSSRKSGDFESHSRCENAKSGSFENDSRCVN
jgi:hypothetical protein